ncbi:MAG: hypothetical protein EPN23_00660 [Verrucomicrobia bacterium]|nr:MAG: hypothetical protein EPN23_00660 [Verrucomicrobiota bacterium]
MKLKSEQLLGYEGLLPTVARWVTPVARLHTHDRRSPPLAVRICGAKFTYIKLNIAKPCPPRGSVPVNRPLRRRCWCWAAFGHEFGLT